NNLAVLWCRGTYSTAQSFDAAVVGILEKKLEPIDLFTYTDASLINTSLADGSPLITTGPDANTGASDNKWHQRNGVGNNGSIFTSSELSSGENAPLIKTQIDLPGGET